MSAGSGAATKTLPPPPPRGMIKIDNTWQLRRFGLLVQRRLTCIFGHHIKLGEGRTFEVAIPCGHVDLKAAFPDRSWSDSRQREPGGSAGCSAHLYVFTTRPRFLWAMDVTLAESEIIDHYSMDVEAIVSHFGVGFPLDMKISSSASIARPPAGA